MQGIVSGLEATSQAINSLSTMVDCSAFYNDYVDSLNAICYTSL